MERFAAEALRSAERAKRKGWRERAGTLRAIDGDNGFEGNDALHFSESGKTASGKFQSEFLHEFPSVVPSERSNFVSEVAGAPQLGWRRSYQAFRKYQCGLYSR